ncbi:MAG: phosphotransferase [Patescibacteria group bacterium]
MATSPTTIFSRPAAARRFLLPRLRRVYPGSVGSIIFRPLHSVQSGRGVVRLFVTFHGQTRRRLELFANYDARGGSRDIYRFLRYLATHGFARGRWRAPRPLWYSATYHTLVYESYRGRRVRDDLTGGRLSVQSLTNVVTQAAGWLRTFHRLPARVGRRRAVRLPVDIYGRASAGPQSASVVARINQAVAAANRISRLALVHGDPHLANCIRGQDGGFALIDYSESYLGNPLADVAMFVVHLDVALQPFFRRAEVSRIQGAFLRNYFGRPVHQLPVGLRRDLVAYEARAAMVFLRFTTNHHCRPTGYVGWIVRRLESVIRQAVEQLNARDPRPVLAA